jgi:proteasome lid subunit RPN8/RPN11
MAAVQLRAAVREDMIAHAREEAPRECCGLLIGRNGVVVESVRTRNVHSSPTRYLVDPAQHIATNRRLRGNAYAVIGCYHSHPTSPAIPSDIDRAEAYYDEFVWMIVSLAVADAPAIAGYRLLNGTFVAIDVVTLSEDVDHANH